MSETLRLSRIGDEGQMAASSESLSTKMDDIDVLIVGAGPTGLMLACELARRGVSIRVLESLPAPQSGSRGKGIQPRTLEVLDNLGIVDRVLANGRMGMPIRSVGPDGRETVTGSVEPVPRPDAPYVASLITPQWRIEEALRHKLTERGGEVSFGAELVAFEQVVEGVVATVTRGAARQTLNARWLVGCDGGRSTVRHQAGISFLGETMDDMRMIVADVGVDGLDREHWHMWRHTDGFLALCPLPSTNLFQFQASIAPGQDPALTIGNMRALIASRSGRTDLRLQDPSWTSLWRANVRMVDHVRDGRVFLAGDAAHVHSPAGGQGMNTGIQDAHNLGWKLAAVLKGAPAELLDTYEEERLPVAASVLALSNELLQKAVETRGIVIDRTARTQQLGINYRGSPLCRDFRDGEASLRAGDRAPDAPGLATMTGERRLFDLLRGGHFTLLVFGNSMPPVEVLHSPTVGPVKRIRVVDELGHADDVVDTHGHLAAAYQPKSGTAVLIRPDGYLALIGDGGDDQPVQAYFSDLLGAGVSTRRSTDLHGRQAGSSVEG